MKNYFLLTLLMFISSLTFSQTINGQLGEFETNSNPFDSTLFVTLQIRLNDGESAVLGHAYNIKFNYDTLALQFINGTYLNFNEINGYQTQPILRPGGSSTIQNIETELISGSGQSATDSWIDFIVFEFKIIDFSLVSNICPHTNSNGFHFYSPNSLQDWTIGEWLCYVSNIPVELTSFTAISQPGSVTLNWTTATEINNHGFEIEKRFENSEWKTISFIEGHGTTTEPNNYNFTDKDLHNGKYYYRLKQVDFDGSYEYSNVIEVEGRVLNSYQLYQNYPNPFNPITTINYSIPNSSFVQLIVYNSIGQEIAILANEIIEAGNHNIDFDATNLPSGIYFYQLQAGSFVETKKMVLMK